MLAFEVEDVNSETNVLEVRIFLNHFGEGAIVVKEDVIQFDIPMKGVLDHFLS